LHDFIDANYDTSRVQAELTAEATGVHGVLLLLPFTSSFFSTLKALFRSISTEMGITFYRLERLLSTAQCINSGKRRKDVKRVVISVVEGWKKE
jgi:hypothetical protein